MTGGRQATGNEAPTTDTERPDYEAAIRAALFGAECRFWYGADRVVAAAIRPLVAAEVAAARADERERCERLFEAARHEAADPPDEAVQMGAS